MNEKPTSSMKRRLNGFITIMFIIVAIAIVINLISISIKDSTTYQELANNQQFSSKTVTANRGTIYDKNGNILAQSITVYTIGIDPTALKKSDSDKKELIISTLAKLLEVDEETVRERADKASQYEIIKRKVEKSVADAVIDFKSDNNISCIICLPDSKRVYPYNDMAASVIGFTGYEGHGQYGLEAEYDEYLSGVDGKIITAKDGMGQEMPYQYEQSFPAQDGNSLVLTIDSNIQHYVEKALNEAVAEHAPNNRACAIAMNPSTGEIYAMATKPDFDLNNPTEITDAKMIEFLSQFEKGTEEYTKQRAILWEKQWKNKAITELYNPGSVFKVITGASAIEDKAISLTETFMCSGSIVVGGETINCWSSRAHGAQIFAEALTHSCNPAFVQIGLRLGIERFSAYYSAFGLDTKTGIDLPGEGTSIYHSADSMTELDLAVSSFGQSHKITPIEMITAYAAVINGGYLVTPYVVDRIVDSNGNIVKQYEPEIKKQVISEETSAIMRQCLETVVETNGGSNAYIQGYRIGGKSGTSQKIDEYGPVEGKSIYVSSYCGFAPADDPEIIMLVMVDEPSNGKYYGSLVASPVVASTFKEALPYLGYFPEYTDEEFEKMSVVVPDVTDATVQQATATISSYDITPEILGEGTSIIKQVPAAGSTMPRTGKVYLFTEDMDVPMTTVPDVTGKSLTEANIILANAGLNIMPTGGAANNSESHALSQNYVGVNVPKGTIVEVLFVTNDYTG